jgi:transcriptional regulator with XRE-family HTH domain
LSDTILVRKEVIPQAPGPQRANWFKGELLKKGVAIQDIARRLGVSAQLVSRVLRGYDRSVRVEQEICRILGLDWEQVFPPLQRRKRIS